MSDHTYDKWQELGYQVKHGESATYTHYGQKIFTRGQVVDMNCNCECNDSSKDYNEYENHCWNCKEDISSHSEDRCNECEMFICSNCGECMC